MASPILGHPMARVVSPLFLHSECNCSHPTAWRRSYKVQHILPWQWDVNGYTRGQQGSQNTNSDCDPMWSSGWLSFAAVWPSPLPRTGTNNA
eukprot:12065416-Heterocapsa_arctica.AAC.1